VLTCQQDVKHSTKYVLHTFLAVAGSMIALVLLLVFSFESEAESKPVNYRDIDIGLAIPEDTKVLRSKHLSKA